MTFEEWVDRTIPMTDAEKNFAWFAWKAATKAEREACAKVCEGKDPHPDEYSPDAEYAEKRTALACAEAIRMRSNT